MTGTQLVAFGRIGHLSDGLNIKQRLAEILLREISEARKGDWTMKSNQLRVLVECEVDRRDVAVPEKDLWIAMDQIVVDAIQQMHRPVAAAKCERGAYLFAAEHCLLVIKTLINRKMIVAHSLASVFAQFHP